MLTVTVPVTLNPAHRRTRSSILRWMAVCVLLVMAVAALVFFSVRDKSRTASELTPYDRALSSWMASADSVASAMPPYAGMNDAAIPAQETDLYVSPEGKDSNDGSKARPFATIVKAASTVKPGTTVHVLPGTYEGVITTTISGKSSARIRYISEKKWAAKLHVRPADGAGVHWDNRSDYIDIVGFDMSGGHSYGIYNRGSHVRVMYNHIHDYQLTCGKGGSGIEHGINNDRYSSVDNDTIGNVVHNVRPPASCPDPHGVGIYLAVSGGHVYNNVSYNNGKDGIQLWHAATGAVVANNTVFANRWSGILVGNEGMCCGSSTRINDHTVVVNNISVHNGKYGLEEYGRTGLNNIYANNVVFGNKQADVHLQNSLKAKDTIVADPQFVRYDPTTADGDYRLKPASSARGKCTKLGAPAYDVEGNRRFANKTCSIGAYE